MRFELLIGPKDFAYWLVTAAVGLVAAAMFFVNTKHRRVIAKALERERNTETPLLEPERKWSYGRAYLETFHITAAKAHIRAGESALARYIRPTLIPNDIVFAVAFGIFIALLALGLAFLLPWKPASDYLMLCVALSGLLYGIADVFEDWRLARIFEGGLPIDEYDAQTVNWLTRIKFVMIVLSGFGAVIFLLLGAIFDLFKR